MSLVSAIYKQFSSSYCNNIDDGRHFLVCICEIRLYLIWLGFAEVKVEWVVDKN